MCVCVCVYVCVYVRACVGACVGACVRARVYDMYARIYISTTSHDILIQEFINSSVYTYPTCRF